MSRLRPRRMSRREELLAASESARTVYSIGRTIERAARATPVDASGVIVMPIATGLQRMWGALVKRSRLRRKGAR